MYYSDEIVGEIRENNDIVELISSYISLKQKGSAYFGLCPFHNESTASFSVSTDKQLFHCFGCGASGNVYSFVMKMENYDFPEAIKFLADRIHYSLPEENTSLKSKQDSDTKNILYDINKAAARFFYDNLMSKDGVNAKKYLDLRLINTKIRVKYGIGYSTEGWDKLYKYLLSKGYALDDVINSGLIIKNKKGGYFDRFRDRLMFPIFDVNGKIVGFGGRALSDQEPKYLNSPETIIFNKSKSLYSINYARQSRQKEVILVEGYMDVLSLYQSGFNNVVASLGTSFNIEHAKLLYKYVNSVVIAFDTDQAGINATLKAIESLISNGLKVKVLQLEKAKDPDEFIKIFGSDKFKEALSNSKNHIDFQIINLSKNFDIEKPDQKIEFTTKVSKLLSNTKSDIELDAYIYHISKLTNISQASIRSEIMKNTNQDFKVLKHKTSTDPKNKLEDKVLYEAKKNIIYIISSDFFMYQKIKNHLQPHEMGEDIYVKTLEILYSLHSKKNDIYPADIVNYFATIEEQKVVSDIFSTYSIMDNAEYVEQAVNDQLKKIKKSYIDEKISKAEDIAELQQLINTRRNIETLNISVLDG